MGNMKKRGADDEFQVKRKKFKKSNANKLVDQVSDKESTTFETAELLDAQTIREGMLLLGCVTEVKQNFLEMSLPGFLSGKVPLSNISTPFTKTLKEFTTNAEIKEPYLPSLVKVGMMFPCRVIEISQDSNKNKSSIILSINPKDVNCDLKPNLLYPKMVLFVSVSSIEDHGCIVDTGNNFIQGFLPKQYYQDHRENFEIGEVIPVSIKQISSENASARLQLSLIDLQKALPTVAVEDVNLNTILPGARIPCDVIEIKHPFVYMKYSYFEVCSSVLSFGPEYTRIKIGKQIIGTVLYVHPITRMIYVSLNLKPSSEHFENLGWRKYTCVKNLKYFCSYKKFSYYVINKGTLGFFHPKDLPKSGITMETHSISNACILRCHYMDNLLQLSAKPSLLEKDIIFSENVQIGEIYDAVVLEHIDEGMFVRICPGLSGFVRRIHMSDVFVTKPEILHPVGSKIKCRVLSTDGKNKLQLTCKESLLKLHNQYVLSSYESVQKGQFYKGVIVQKTPEYILVLFFNDIKGIVPSYHVPKEAVFYEGQTVLCEVLSCNSFKKKLRLSLETENRCSLEDISDVWNENSVYGKSNILNHKEMVHHQNINNNDIDSNNSMLKINSIQSSDNSASPSTDEINTGIPIKTVIKSIKGNQLNVMINAIKGRVHITELGCISEDAYPLRDYSVGQEVQVYVVGEIVKEKKNFLKITHKNYIVLKECSLNYPPYSLSQDFKPGKSCFGFVKEVHDTSVFLWLSPTQIGILEYLHFSENIKVIKSLHRHLKIGLSIKISVLDNNEPIIKLTKIEKVLPALGRNIIGLVQIPCSESGLVLKLPYDYHGFVSITDLTDVYSKASTLFKKYSKFKFLLCHVIEVNHQTKYCQLSLRKSRVYGEKNVSNAKFCPEITKDNIEVGSIMKGFVKSISSSAITVILGRNLEGKVQIHTCSSTDCRLCENSKNIITKYPVRSVVEVTIKENFKDGRSCILDLKDSQILKSDECNRLDVTEDISWDEDDD